MTRTNQKEKDSEQQIDQGLLQELDQEENGIKRTVPKFPGQQH